MDKETKSTDSLNELVTTQVNALLDQNAEKIKEELLASGSILPAEQLFEIKKQHFLDEIKSINKEMNRLGMAIETFIANKNRFLTAEEIAQQDKEIMDWTSRFLYTKPPSELGDKALQEMLGISNFTLFCFYRVAYGLYQERQYPEAADIFLFLSILNPYVKDYWTALGIAERENGHYVAALNAFTLSSLMDANDPAPHLNSVDCYLRNHDRAGAQTELTEAKEAAKKNKPSQWQPLIDNMQVSIDQLNIRG